MKKSLLQLSIRRKFAQERYYAKYGEEAREKQRVRSRQAYERNREKMRLAFKTRYYSDPKFRLYKDRIRHAFMAKYKSMIFDILGKVCAKCGFSDIRALQIDHIHGDGHLQKVRSSSYYKEVYTSAQHQEGKFQILCANCNWIKRVENNEHIRKT